MKNVCDWNRYLGLCLTLIMVTMTGCKDGNLFGKLHKSGDSGDVRSLNSDAQAAYRSQDYSRSLDLYNRALNVDPNNSQALLGASSAAIASSGLDLATLLTNVISQTSASSSIAGIADVISRSHISGGVSAQGDLLAGINKTVLDSVLTLAICRLQKIAAGAADGSISPNDLDLLVNFGVLCLLRAVTKAELKSLLAVNNNSGNFTITSSLTTGICNGSTLISGFSTVQEQKDYLVNIAKDVAGAYAIYAKALNNSSLGNNSVIGRLKADLATVNNELLTVSASIPQECIDTFSAGGITVSNFTSFTGPFTTPSGC